MGEVFALSKRRIKFAKLGLSKFISHLDLQRTFARAVMRSGLPVKYSNGFNPHQIMTFSLPLAVGVTSESEYVDIDFDESASNEEVEEKLKKALPPDIKLIKVSMPQVSANDICAAEYILKFCDICLEKEKLESFFEEKELAVIKKSKKGDKEVNLKDYIIDCEILELNENSAKLKAVLKAGGSKNIKPSLFAEKLLSYMGKDLETIVYIHRTEIFYDNGKEMKTFC